MIARRRRERVHQFCAPIDIDKYLIFIFQSLRAKLHQADVAQSSYGIMDIKYILPRMQESVPNRDLEIRKRIYKNFTNNYYKQK